MKTMIEIREATKAQASDIARLIMMAMTDDCCQHFCGVGHGLEDFLKMMTSLVEREDSQYSYRNTLVAMADNKVVGIAVSYDGGKLHELRQAFIKAAKEYIGKDHSGMDDETQAGELYLDSLAVLPDYRRQGIAQCLLHATKEKADKMGALEVIRLHKGVDDGRSGIPPNGETNIGPASQRALCIYKPKYRISKMNKTN
jgi:DNA-3-methyladenine glycosylase I